MLVSFKQIQALYPSDVSLIQPGTTNPALGPIVDGGGGRTSVYDPLWGYFTFEQRSQCIFGEGQTYNTQATFSIRGVFTANAEQVQDQSESVMMTTLIAKLNALEAKFLEAAGADAPEDYANWGTATDNRVIVLPEPLRDKDGNRVYALPAGLQVRPAPFVHSIAYEATLLEAIYPAAKLKINDTMLDNGVVTIVPPQPILSVSPLVGAKGAAISCKNYMPREIHLAGTMPYNPRPGNALPENTKSLIISIQDSGMDVKTVERLDSGVVENVLWSGLDAEGPEVSVDYRNQVVQVAVRGK